MQAETGPQYGLTPQEQRQESSDINAVANGAVAADGQQISNQIATAAGGAANAGDAPLTNNEEPTLPEVVVSAPPIPAGADTALDIYANLVQRSPTTGKPTYAQPLAVEALGDTASLYYGLRQQGIVPSAGLQGMVADEVTNATGNSAAGNVAFAALQQEAASDQAALQGQENNFSTTDVANENAAEIFKTFGPYPVVAGAWNLGAKAVSGLAGLATLAFTGNLDEATSAINSVQSSLQLNLSSRLTAAIGQTASPYVNAEQAFLDNHFGVGTETIVNSGIEFGADTLGVLGVGSTLRELAPELNATYSLRSPLVPVGAGEMGMFGIKGFQNPLVASEMSPTPSIGGDLRGPVTFKAPPDATPEEIAQVQEYVRLSNEALNAGALSSTGRVSTAGELRDDASAAASEERARAEAAGDPYEGHVGHVPDTTWTGTASGFSLSCRIYADTVCI